MSFNRRAGASGGTMALVIVCATFAAGAGESVPGQPALPIVPAAAHERTNPYAGQRDAIAAGKKLFERHCATCHGDRAEGTRRGPGLVGEHATPLTPGDAEWIIRNGAMASGMPSWSGLPAQRRWQLVAFLQAN
jgi:mono/diheme cytochrome c family protein